MISQALSSREALPKTASLLYWEGNTFSYNTRPGAQQDLQLKMQLAGRNSVVALDDTPRSANMAPPVGLDDSGSLTHLAVAPADTPHADPGLQPDHCPLLLLEGIQYGMPPLLQNPRQ